MKAHVFGEIRQPVHGGLQTYHALFLQQGVEPLLTGCGRAEFFEVKFYAKWFLKSLDDGLRRHAIGHQRQAAEFDERQVGEGQRRRQAKDQRLGNMHAVMTQKIGHDAAFAMCSMTVLKCAGQGIGVHGRRHKDSLLMPSASA